MIIFLGDSIYQVHLELGSINPFFPSHLIGSSFVTSFYVLGVVKRISHPQWLDERRDDWMTKRAGIVLVRLDKARVVLCRLVIYLGASLGTFFLFFFFDLRGAG